MFQAKRFFRRGGMSTWQPQPTSAKCATNSGHADHQYANGTLVGTEMEVRIRKKGSILASVNPRSPSIPPK
jgi:hypothetical protein